MQGLTGAYRRSGDGVSCQGCGECVWVQGIVDTVAGGEGCHKRGGGGMS